MGIQAEYSPDLALRNISEFKAGRRQVGECIPEKLEAGNAHDFLKKGQKLFWLHGEIPLRETQGDQVLSRPKASVVITEITHFLLSGEVWTKGRYKVVKILGDEVYFEGYEKIK